MGIGANYMVSSLTDSRLELIKELGTASSMWGSSSRADFLALNGKVQVNSNAMTKSETADLHDTSLATDVNYVEFSPLSYTKTGVSAGTLNFNVNGVVMSETVVPTKTIILTTSDLGCGR